MSEDFTEDLVTKDIQGIGVVRFQSVNFNILIEAEELIENLPEDEHANVFVSHVIKEVVLEPDLILDKLERLDSQTKTGFINVLVDVWGIRETFEKTKNETSLFERVYQAHIAKIEPILSALGNSLYNFLQKVKSDVITIQTALEKADFWLTPSNDFHLISQIRNLIDQGMDTPQKIQAVITNYYESNKFANLDKMTKMWNKDKYFNRRMHIIEPAIKAHKKKQYILSIPTLLPQIEGILLDITGKKSESYDKWFKKIIEEYFPNTLKEAYRVPLLNYTTDRKMYREIRGYFETDLFSKFLENENLTGDHVLQRHGILHGIHLDYASKENSLRALMVLDFVYWIAEARKRND